jgi:hypothetical protein
MDDTMLLQGETICEWLQEKYSVFMWLPFH